MSSFLFKQQQKGGLRTGGQHAKNNRAKGNWYPLTECANTTVISREVELGFPREAREIMVEQSYASEVEQR